MTATEKRPTSVPTLLLDRIAMRAALASFGVLPPHNVNGATLRVMLEKAQAYESMRVAALIEDGDREIRARRASNLSAGAHKAWDTRRARAGYAKACDERSHGDNPADVDASFVGAV